MSHKTYFKNMAHYQFPCIASIHAIFDMFLFRLLVYFLQDIRSLLEFFPKCLEKHASSSNPVVLVLDSLDQLSDDDGGRELDWVPKKLPRNVYIILSTLPGEEYNCFPKLQVLRRVVSSKHNKLFHYCVSYQFVTE